MPPKRRSTGPAAKSQQSTLAFHGASNKVVKPGTRAANAKKNLLTKEVKKEEPVVHDVKVEEEEEQPTAAEAAIIKQTEQVEQAEATPEEEAARRVTQKQIAAYWKKQEAENVVPRAHQGDLSVEEKILRKFDMSNQYGVRMPTNAAIARTAPLSGCIRQRLCSDKATFESPQAALNYTNPNSSPASALPG